MTGPRLQQPIADAIRRMRTTRADGRELMEVVVQIGRRQIRDALARARRAAGKRWA